MAENYLANFYAKLGGFSQRDGRKQVDYFAYYLTVIRGQESFTPEEIRACFFGLTLKEYSRIARYLSEEVNKTKSGKYLKRKRGYTLELKTLEKFKSEIEGTPKKIAVSQNLTDLLSSVSNREEYVFLKEAINCLRVNACRASIIMVWNLAIYHLRNHIFSNPSTLTKFNNAFAKSPEKKFSTIKTLDDFSDLKESKFIELCRAARLISNDVKKILEEKLGIRNSAAHPSSVVFDSHKATEFALDLINNVILKY